MHFFGQLFATGTSNTSNIARQTNARVAPISYGEALTSVEFLTRLQEEKENGKRQTRKRKSASQQTSKSANKNSRSASRSAKKQKLEEAIGEDACYYVCGRDDSADTEEEKLWWIGCDSHARNRWFHYWCADLDELPDSNAFWACPVCEELDYI